MWWVRGCAAGIVRGGEGWEWNGEGRGCGLGMRGCEVASPLLLRYGMVRYATFRYVSAPAPDSEPEPEPPEQAKLHEHATAIGRPHHARVATVICVARMIRRIRNARERRSCVESRREPAENLIDSTLRLHVYAVPISCPSF